jgi:2-oxoglutarate dehydrogenase E2 component (dihydrolipoamide succinyltransferase)
VRDVARRNLPRLRGRGLAHADHGRFGDAAVDVLARNPPVATGTLDARRLDPMLLKRAADAMTAAPAINGRWEDDRIAIPPTIDIGVGTALGEKGLVVPVVRDSGSLTLEQIGAKLDDLTRRARDGQLTPADVSGGSFTISNHGVSGSLLAAPIILHQGQAAILGVGKLEKRVAVREVEGEDGIVILPMAYVTLTIDHRVVDGHQTNAWLTRFVELLERWPPA